MNSWAGLNSNSKQQQMRFLLSRNFSIHLIQTINRAGGVRRCMFKSQVASASAPPAGSRLSLSRTCHHLSIFDPPPALGPLPARDVFREEILYEAAIRPQSKNARRGA
jgi:hypothetical protein